MMADEDLSLNEDQLLENLDDQNGDGEMLNEVKLLIPRYRKKKIENFQFNIILLTYVFCFCLFVC